MKIEPVYLLAPKPKAPTVPTRRAFLLAGGTFLAGVGLGGACGFVAGSRGGGEDGDGVERQLPSPSGDAELDELRRLALQAPIEELTTKWLYFTDVYSSSYRSDDHLPTGIERLIDHVVSNASLKQRRIMAKALSQVVEMGEPSLQQRLKHHLPQLAKIR